MPVRPPPILRRALLYVPSSSPRFLASSRSLRADCIAYDLEDSVTLAAKATARNNLRDFLANVHKERAQSKASIGAGNSRKSELAVRINSVASGLALDDLTTVLSAPGGAVVDAVVLPKVEGQGDVRFVEDVLRYMAGRQEQEGSSTSREGSREQPSLPRIIALVESARAICDLREICTSSELLSGLIFAAEDFALDMGITRTESLREFLYARSAVVTACRAYGLDSAIDLVCTEYKGDAGARALEQECEDGRRLGFTGKQCIHPSQVDVVQEAFAPGSEELEWAVRVVVGDEAAEREGKGAWTLDGKMIDAPVVGKARSVVEMAEACGIEVGTMRKKWETGCGKT